MSKKELQTSNNVRVVAAVVIAEVEAGSSLTTSLDLHVTSITEKKRSLLRQLCYGTLRHYFSLSRVRKNLLKKPLKSKESVINALILTGIYQLIHSSVPAYAVINETVNAVKIIKKNWAVGVINAVLRSVQRQRNDLFNPSDDDLPALWDHPVWFIDALKASWPEHWQHILKSNNEQAPMTLRVNRLHSSRQSYLDELKKAGINAKPTSLAVDGITLDEAISVEKLPGFDSGAVSVQDEAAQLAAEILQCLPSMRVLDACAAPGGKTCHLLEKTDDLTILALDINKKRLSYIEENLNRLNLKAKLVCGDASAPKTWWDGQLFDRILLDAPCSGTGVIRRHPDIKLLRRKSDIDQLSALQGKLLETLWALLKPGGIMVYATCSVLSEENSIQIKQFISQQNNATILPVPFSGTQNDTSMYCYGTYGIQFFPKQGAHDGFFYSVLKKTSQD